MNYPTPDRDRAGYSEFPVYTRTRHALSREQGLGIVLEPCRSVKWFTFPTVYVTVEAQFHAYHFKDVVYMGSPCRP